jgi:hypothetical protein
MEEIEYSKALGLAFFVVAIDAPDELRRKRQLREKDRGQQDLKRLEERDKREISWGLQKLLQMLISSSQTTEVLTSLENRSSLVELPP